MSQSVFISHAAADKSLIEAFVRLLEDGIGVPEEKIFCTSIPGMGIPTGKSFVNYICDEMDSPSLIIVMITPNYLASRFCQGEMGAAWIKGHRIYPIIVPPATFSDLDGVFLGTQAVLVNDDVRANDLKEALVEGFQFKPKSAARWDVARKEFFGILPTLVNALPKPQTVSLHAYNDLQSEYDEALVDIGEQQEDIRRSKRQIEALEAAKDAKAVAAIAAEFDQDGINERLIALLKDAKSALRELGSNSLRLHVLAQHYGKPYEGWRDDRETFDAAIIPGVICDDPRYDSFLARRRRPTRRAIRAVKSAESQPTSPRV